MSTCPMCQRVDPEGGLRRYVDVYGRPRESCVDDRACLNAWAQLPEARHRAEQRQALRRMHRQRRALPKANLFGTWSR